MSRDALIGLAIAGIMMGALSASIFSAGADGDGPVPAHIGPGGLGGAPMGGAIGAGPIPVGATAYNAAPQARAGAQPAASQAPAEIPGFVLQVADALTSAHTKIHKARGGKPGAKGGEAGADLPAGLRAEIVRDDWLQKLRIDMHQILGPGALISGGRLTALGQELMSRLGDLESHAQEPARFYMPATKEKVDAFLTKIGGGDIEPPAAAGDAGPVLVELLQSPRLDRDKAIARLMEAGGTPRPEHVQTLADAMTTAALSPANEREEMQVEAIMGRALMRYVLEMRFFKRAHPYRTTRNESSFANYKTRAPRVRGIFESLSAAGPSGFKMLDPLHPQYAQIREFYKTYQGYVANADCPKVEEDRKLQEGSTGPAVRMLKARLACEGYYRGHVDDVFDSDTVSAVKLYQRHHELKPDGHAWEKTLQSLNIPLEKRLAQLKLALQRLRESNVHKLGNRYIRINVPLFEMQLYENSEMIENRRVVVGTNRLDDDKVALVQGHLNRTKLFETELYNVIVNPDWIMPLRVEIGEIATKLKEDKDYLKKKNIERHTLPDGKVVFIQGRGDDNVLGQVKFVLRESHAIFLHDTDKKHIFDNLRRDESHGCVRVDKAVQFAKDILEHDGYKPKVIRATFKRNAQAGLALKNPIPLITEYVTVDVSEELMPIFLTDLYGYDKAYFAKELPVVDRARWGSNVLRPSWVPVTSDDVVNHWKTMGAKTRAAEARRAVAKLKKERKDAEAARAAAKAAKDS